MTPQRFKEDHAQKPTTQSDVDLSLLKNQIMYHQQTYERIGKSFIRAGVRALLIKYMIEYNNAVGKQVYKPAEL